MTDTRAPAPTVDGEALRDGISMDGIFHWFFGSEEPRLVLEEIDLEVPEGQFVAIVGRSGCGKTTLLNMVAGLVTPTAGRLDVVIEGKPLPPPSPQIGYMWARDALLPWRTLLRNVEFGLELRVRGVPRAERRQRALAAIAAIGLGGSEAKYPRQLSQGMRQRGNLARLLVTEPTLILMDEPFASVDSQTKAVLQQDYLDVWERLRRTVLYVTHDLEEAALMADRVLVMADGTITHDLSVPTARPRVLDAVRFEAEHQAFVHELWGLLHGRERQRGDA